MPEPIPTNKSARAAPPVSPARGRGNEDGDRRQVVPVPRRQANVARRREFDGLAITAAIGLGITVLVPWLVGKYVLRDSWIFPQSEAVFDRSVRGEVGYFAPDYVGGLLVIGALLVTVLLIGPWAGRIGSITLGLAVAAGLLYGVPKAQSLWGEAEAAAADALKTTAFPFSEHYEDREDVSGCQDVEFSIRKTPWLIGVSSPRAYWVSSDSFLTSRESAGCRAVSVYKGWRQIKSWELPKGVVDEIFVRPGKSYRSTYAVAVVNTSATGVYLAGFSMGSSTKYWTRSLKNGRDNEFGRMGAMITEEREFSIEDEYGQKHSSSKLIGYSMSTGRISWIVQCPSGYAALWISDVREDDPTEKEMLCDPVYDSAPQFGYRFRSNGELRRVNVS